MPHAGKEGCLFKSSIQILIEITNIMSMYWCCVCYLKWARNVYIIHGMRCGIDLLIKHEVKPSALSHHRYSGRVSMILHEAHTSVDAYSCVKYIYTNAPSPL